MSRRLPPPPPLVCLATLVASTVLPTLTGCRTAAPPPPEGVIKYVDADPTPRGPDGTVPRHAVRCVLRTVTVPLVRPLTDLWASVDENAVPALSRSVWNANGLRVGLLNASDAAAFGKALGPPTDFGDHTLIAYERPTVLLESPPLQAVFFADLTVPPGPARIEILHRGRARLLTTMSPTGPASAGIRLIPQHHLPRTTLLARNPLEKLLDGRVFDELAQTVRVNPGQALVLGYNLPARFIPPPPEPEREDQINSNDDPDAPTPPPPDLEIDLDDLPLDLGRALLTLGRDPDEQQRLLLITVVETR